MKNAIYLIFADLASKGVGGLLGLVLARFLGVAEYGRYAIAVAICGLFLLISAVGLEQELTRRGGLDKDTTHQALRLNLVCLVLLTSVAYVLTLLFLLVSDYSADIRLLTLAAGVALVVARFHLPFRNFWLVKRNILPVAVAQSLGTFSILAGTLLILYLQGPVLHIILLQGLVAALVLVYYLKTLPEFTGVRSLINTRSVYGFLKDSIPFGLSSMIWVAYFNFDVVMLSMFESEDAVGLYGGLYRIMAVSYIVGYALTNSFTPRLFQLYGRMSFSEFAATGRSLIAYLLLAGSIFSMSLLLWADTIIDLILGSQYSDGVLVLKILGISAFFRFVNFGLCEIMTTSGHQNSRVRRELLMLLINLCGNGILIPLHGAAGAALATLFSEIFLLSLVGLFLYRNSILSVRQLGESHCTNDNSN